MTGAQAEAPDKPFVMPTAEFAEPLVLTSKQVDRQSFHSKSFIPKRLVIPSIDVDASIEDIHYQQSTSIEEGVSRFVQWYREFYRV